MKALVLKHREWDHIFTQVKKDYADTPATYLIRNRMRDALGWTYREHQEWDPLIDYLDDWRDQRSKIHIDFYSEEARTFFMLRYMAREDTHFS